MGKSKFSGKQGEPAAAAAKPKAAAPAQPPKANEPAAAAATDPAAVADLEKRVADQGNHVRQLKANKAAKEEINVAVAELLDLKKKLTIAQGGNPAQDEPKK